MSRYEEWCPVCKSPIVMVTRGIPSMGRCMSGHTTDRRDTLRREPVKASPLSAAMELPEVKALVEAARKTLVAAELREIYHRLPNDKNRIGDPKSPKAKARDAWLKAFRRASSATSLALAAIKEPKT